MSKLEIPACSCSAGGWEISVGKTAVDGLSVRPVYDHIPLFYYYFGIHDLMTVRTPVSDHRADSWPHGKHLHSFSNYITTEICGYKFRFLTAGQRGGRIIEGLVHHSMMDEPVSRNSLWFMLKQYFALSRCPNLNLKVIHAALNDNH